MFRGPGARGSSRDVQQVQIFPRELEHVVPPASPKVSLKHEAPQISLAPFWPHHLPASDCFTFACSLHPLCLSSCFLQTLFHLSSLLWEALGYLDSPTSHLTLNKSLPLSSHFLSVICRSLSLGHMAGTQAFSLGGAAFKSRGFVSSYDRHTHAYGRMCQRGERHRARAQFSLMGSSQN